MCGDSSSRARCCCGQVFVPPIKSERPVDFGMHEFWLGRVAAVFVMLVMGWPSYLVANVTGRPYPRWANHFDPSSPIFSKRERVEVHRPRPRLPAARASSQ